MWCSIWLMEFSIGVRCRLLIILVLFDMWFEKILIIGSGLSVWCSEVVFLVVVIKKVCVLVFVRLCVM